MKFAKQPQPRITGVKLDVALYPSETRAVTNGEYVIENRTQGSLGEVHINLSDELEIKGSRSRAPASRKHTRSLPIASTGSTSQWHREKKRKVRFTTVLEQKGFKNSGNNTSILHSRTF